MLALERYPKAQRSERAIKRLNRNCRGVGIFGRLLFKVSAKKNEPTSRGEGPRETFIDTEEFLSAHCT